jgi:hypothetical protein
LGWIGSIQDPPKKKVPTDSSFDELYSDNILTEENSSQGGGKILKKKEPSLPHRIEP